AQVGMSTLDGQMLRRGLTVEAGKSAWMSSFVVQNGAYQSGGGARIDGLLVAAQMVFRYNVADDGSGLYVGHQPGVLELRDSGIYYNERFIHGGGMYLGGGKATLWNVTVSNNKGPCSSTDKCLGRGASFYDAGGTLAVYFSTVAQNKGAEQLGSGVFVAAPSNIFFFNSIMANDCNASLITFGWNVERGNTCGFNSYADQVNVDPGLESLQNNGGQSWTHALRYYSPALNAGIFCPASDQRGVARPQWGACDVGAYEYDGFL